MEDKQLLPIGTILYSKNTARKLMIVARGAFVKQENKNIYFDYAGCLYPEGILKDELFYFSKEDIDKTIHLGYEDEDEKQMRETLLRMIPKMKERLEAE